MSSMSMGPRQPERRSHGFGSGQTVATKMPCRHIRCRGILTIQLINIGGLIRGIAMPASARAQNEPSAPISDAVLARLYRADGDEVRAIAEGLPMPTRVDLALFCYARVHLREIGLQIAD